VLKEQIQPRGEIGKCQNPDRGGEVTIIIGKNRSFCICPMSTRCKWENRTVSPSSSAKIKIK